MSGPSFEVIVRLGEEVLVRHELEPGEYVFGRDPEAHIVMDTIDGVSRRHAQIAVFPDHTEVSDLGSSNGTYVNGKRVHQPTRLWPNQKISIGEATVELRRLKADTLGPRPVTAHTQALREALPEEFLREKKYEIGGLVAQGGMGAILDAHEATTGRTVAMKVMLENASPDDLRRFITEAKVTAQLEHPNIVPVYELSVDEHDQVFYTMKFVRGITLHTILDLLGKGIPGTVRKYSLSSLLTVFQKVCDALAYAHAKGVIHRDLKPANIMIGDFGEVMVMDWGLAKFFGRHAEPEKKPEQSAASGVIRVGSARAASATLQNAAHTMAGQVFGTPQFMAPEQGRGEVDKLDGRADIYALGAILYNMLALAPPVDGEDPQAVLDLAIAGHITPLNLHAKYPHLPGGRIPDSLAAVVRKALALHPSARYQTVADLQADLAAYQNGFATGAERAGLFKQAQLFLRRNKTAAAAAVAIVALTAAFTAKVIAEGRRAEKALTNLRAAAPTLISQARDLVDQQKFDEALDKISFALQIDPRNPEYHLFRGDVLEAVLRFPEAAAAFRQVLALGPNDSATENLALCEKVIRDNQGKPEIATASLHELHDLMLKEGRATQDAPIAERLGLGRVAIDHRIKALFGTWKKLTGWDRKPENERFRFLPDGTIYLSVRGLPIEDLSPLKGLPITQLEIAETRISDLSPLAGMRLSSLVADQNPALVDLRPLSGMPLDHASFSNCKALRSLAGLEGAPLRTCYFQSTEVEDLTPLAQSPIQVIDCSATPITTVAPLAATVLVELRAGGAMRLEDISAVSRMRWLRKLHLANDTAIRDLSPVGNCAALEELFFSAGPKGIEAIRALQQLRFIIYDGWQLSPEEFWVKIGQGTERDRQRLAVIKKVRAALTAGGAQRADARAVKILSDETIDIIVNREELKSIAPLEGLPISSLDISQSNVTDLSPIAQMPLRRLKIGNLRVADFAPIAQCTKLDSLWCWRSGLRDLTPLQNLPLTEFIAHGNPLTDLKPLAGKPLKLVRLDNTPVTDLAPLAACPNLEWLSIPTSAKNVGVLRSLRYLARISEQWDDRVMLFGRQGGPAQLAAQFWKEYDAKQPAGSK